VIQKTLEPTRTRQQPHGVDGVDHAADFSSLSKALCFVNNSLVSEVDNIKDYPNSGKICLVYLEVFRKA